MSFGGSSLGSSRPRSRVHWGPVQHRQIRSYTSESSALTELSHNSENGLPRRSLQPEERGPFGKPVSKHRAAYRGKSTPLRTAKEDAHKIENIKQEDAIFGKLKEETKAQTLERERSLRRQQSQPRTPTSGSFPFGTTDDDAHKSDKKTPETGEPTEVILYGFPGSFQYAAVEFYERVSGGLIYEDYERYAPNTRFQPVSHRRFAPGQLTTDALRKKNALRSGECWVKVTFNSKDAALQACRASPHVLHGYSVRAELYTGKGPSQDEPIPAISGARGHSTEPFSPFDPLPKSKPRSPSHSTDPKDHTGPPDDGSAPDPTNPVPGDWFSPTDWSSNRVSEEKLRREFQSSTRSRPDDATTTATEGAPTLRPLRVRGAKRAVLLPAEQALLPVTPAWRKKLQSWPVIGPFFGDTEIIGHQVPRSDDGEFDWKNASLYWKFWASVDYWLNTDFCGLRADD